MESDLKDTVKIEAQESALRVVQMLRMLPRWQRVVLLTGIIGIIPGFFIAKYSASFFAGKYYDQYAVTAHASFSNPQDAQASAVTVLIVGDGEYAAYAKITNPNFELSSTTGTYTIKFYNNKNEEVANNNGTFFLLPGQSKYVVAPRVQTSQKVSRAQITLADTKWQKREQPPVVRLRATDPVGHNQVSPQAYVVEGEVANDSPYTLKRSRITLLLKDANNKIIAVSSRDEFDIAPRSRRAYTQTWPGVSTNQVLRVEVQAETNTLDNANLKVEPVNGGSGGLDRPTTDR